MHRPAAALAAALTLLTGCGSSSAGGSADEGGDTRTVSHALGSSEVPAEPGRIVPLDGIYTADLLVLGLEPAGLGDQVAYQLQPYAELAPEVADLAEVPTFGDPYEPNLEALTALDPDLIVGDEFMADLYADFSAIAPTVAVTYIGNGGWRERFPDVAAAVGQEDAVEEIDAEYQAELDAVPDAAREEVVAFVRADPDGSFRIDSLPTAFPGSVAEDAGIPTLEPTGVGEFDEGSGFLQLSAENIGVLAEADRIVVGDNSFYDPALEDSLSVLERNPLWSQVPAVQAGRVEQIPGPVYNGGNYLAARLLLRELADG